ncbi:Dimer-Tnp-hAT domain-containing protein [Pyrenophora tritici-repentis]|nr:Dimer-Tnp-hAT domain-containing protein [Pyrenophora tritici-repentis]
MPAKRTRVNALEIATTSKRPRVAARHRGTASQPVLVDTRPFSPSPPPPPLSPRQALVAAPQAPNFEATLRESRAEETIIPPPEGSEHATVAASGAASEAVDEGFVWVEDKYDGFNWSRYPKHCKPPTSLSNRASWVYSHGYRIALRSNVAKVTWICHYCYKHKFTTVGRGIHDVSQSPSAPARHLGEDKKGHGLKPPSKRTTVAPRKETLLERALQKGCSQAVANELTNFNIQEFRLAAVTWLVENNLPLLQFESSSFRNMIQLASVEAERALWASHNSVSRYVIRLYNYLLPKVVASLSESMSKVHISFDGWTTKGGKRGYLGIVAHYVDSSGELRDLPIALPQLTGAHTGEAMAEVVMAIFKQFEITVGKLGYFVLDNAHNNNTTINTLALQMGFSATERRLRCGPHTLNLIGQMLLWGEEKESYDNEETERVNEAENMATWRGDGPLGVLLAVINYIKTPQQYALFEKYQKLAIRDQPVNAPTEQHKIKEPVKPVVTRWNSYVSCFERAVELQLAVNGYANYHIQKIETEDAYARSRNNKLPAAPDWMRSDGINAHDWQVIAEYIDVLRPLKQATKRLEGRGKSGAFGAIAEVIPVFEYLLGVYEDRLQSYEDVIHDEHTESPEDHLAINLRAALVKAREYYNKLDLSPAYYAATILHPRYKSYLDAAWADKPDWLESSNRKFQHLWAEYKSLPKPRLRPKVRHNDIDDAINSFIEPAGLTENEEDEYEAWKRSEPIASEGVDPIKYWVGLRDRYPSLSKFAIDMLSIPGSSCECERLFSELGDLLEPRRRSISPQLLAAIQCDRRWIRAGFGSGEVPVKEAISDEEMDAKYACSLTSVLGRLHNLVRYIRLTPQRREEFATIIIGGDLSQFDGLELIQNNSTRWNSWFYSITRALNVRERLELFSARHVPGKGSVGIANFKLDGQHWFELEKIELALKDFYAATLLSEGKKTSLADWFSTLDCLLREISETKDHYHDIHTEDDNNFTWKYLQGCADAAWLKCVEYYNNQQLNWQNRFPEDTDLPPAYYAAQILDPYRKWGWFRQEWVLHGDEEKKRWFENAQLAVKHLWETEYKGRYPVEMLPPPARKERDPDPAFDRQREHKRIRIDAPVSTTDLYEQYISTDRLHNEEAGCNEAIAYWLSRYDSQRDLARFALDMFAISPMSDECERLFSSAKLTIVDRRGRLKADIIEACECLRAWYGKPQAEGNSDIEDSENEDD